MLGSMFGKHIIRMQDEVVKWVILLLYMQEVLVSYLSAETGYPEIVYGFH
jgi:hypothetical protein